MGNNIYTPISISTGQVTVGTTAVQIVPFQTARTSVALVNLGTTDVFVGTRNVTASTGVLLVGTKGAAIAIDTRAEVWAITAAGTVTVAFITDGDTTS